MRKGPKAHKGAGAQPPVERHLKTTQRLRLSEQDKQLMASIARERGYDDVSAWAVAMLHRCQAERIPESQGDVKKIIPENIAIAAVEGLTLLADVRQETAQTIYKATGDRALRKHFNSLAGVADDAAGYFATILDDIRYRRHILEAGIREARHRTKAQSPAADSDSASQS